jgi:hypothetical protein
LEAVDSRLTFDDILEAVQDSKRGRWFLQEYEARVQKQGSQTVLQAISRLEARMDGFAAQPEHARELTKVKAAIANARSDLLKIGVGKDALSAEGHLFAHLAELARNAMPMAADNNASIVRSLQLVDEIDRSINPAPTGNRETKFFGPDENLFERAGPTPKPVLVTSTAVEPTPVVQTEKPLVIRKDEPISTGAKLVIRKTSSKEQIENDETLVPTIAPLQNATQEQTRIDTPRIVIIRRRAEDMPEVQVGATSESASAA